MVEGILSLVSLSLIALNLFQLIYWSRQTHKLIDKLMSRNYPEYVQTQNLAAPLPKQQVTMEHVVDQDLDTLNQTLAGFN
jgi:hypothetical protein